MAKLRLAWLILLIFFAPHWGQAYLCEKAYEIPEAKRPQTLWSLPYSQTAQGLLPEVIAQLKTNLGVFRDSHYNPKVAAELRKQILKTRFYLEVFAYAYGRVDRSDPWLDLWTQLKEGYSLIGDFRSLPKSKTKKRKKKMDKIVEWTKTQLDGRLLELETNLYASLVNPLSFRPLPKGLHWDGTALFPRPSMSGREVIQELGHKLLNRSKYEWNGVIRIENLLDAKQAESFHNFRKQLRTSYNLANMIGVSVRSQHPQLTQLLKDLGKINDLIETIQRDSKRADNEGINLDSKIRELNRKWLIFKEKYDAQETRLNLDQLLNHLILAS